MSILSFILHHSNRQTKNPEFYAIKDTILKKYGTQIGYDIQHIPGKSCRSCGGTGQHVRYSMYPPYNAYDWDGCWYCNASGWFKKPQWICLARIRFGSYTFHKPLKREEGVKNPFTLEEIGFEVTQTPVIEGYIDHDETKYGLTCLMLLYLIYDRNAFRKEWKEVKWKIKYRTRSKIWWLKRLFTWDGFVLEKPKQFINHWMNAKGEYSPIDPDLPF